VFRETPTKSSNERVMRVNQKTSLALVGVLLLAGAACGGSATTGVNGDASGTYTLQSIGGKALPFTVSTGATSTLTFKSGALTVNTDKSFSATLSFDENISGTLSSTTSTCVGAYSQQGNSFNFIEASSSDPNCGFTYSGTWNGSNTFSVNFSAGAIAVYTR
jgi:hypothetical protein